MKKRILLSILSLVFLLGGVGNVYGEPSLSEDVQSIYNSKIGERSRNIHQFMLKVTAVLKKVDSNKKMEAMEAFLVGGALKLYLEKMDNVNGLELVKNFVDTIAPRPVTEETRIKNYIEKKLKGRDILGVFEMVMSHGVHKIENTAIAKNIIKRSDFREDFNYEMLSFEVLSYDSFSKKIKLDKKNRTEIAKSILNDKELVNKIEDKRFGRVFKMAAVGGFEDICDLILNGGLRYKLNDFLKLSIGDELYEGRLSFLLNKGFGEVLSEIGNIRESLHESILKSSTMKAKVAKHKGSEETLYKGSEETFKSFSSTKDLNNVHQLESLISVAKLFIENKELIEDFKYYDHEVSIYKGRCFKVLELILKDEKLNKEISVNFEHFKYILGKVEETGNEELADLIKEKIKTVK